MTLELQPAESPPSEASVAAEMQRAARCAHSGRPWLARPRNAPFGLLISVARLVIAVSAALMLIRIVGSLFQGGRYGFAAGELWASI